MTRNASARSSANARSWAIEPGSAHSTLGSSGPVAASRCLGSRRSAFVVRCAGRGHRAPGCLRVTRSRPHISCGLPWFQTSPAAVVTGAVRWVALFHGGQGGAAGWVFRRRGTRSGAGQPAPLLKRKTSTVSYPAGQRRSATSQNPAHASRPCCQPIGPVDGLLRVPEAVRGARFGPAVFAHRHRGLNSARNRDVQDHLAPRVLGHCDGTGQRGGQVGAFIDCLGVGPAGLGGECEIGAG